MDSTAIGSGVIILLAVIAIQAFRQQNRPWNASPYSGNQLMTREQIEESIQMTRGDQAWNILALMFIVLAAIFFAPWLGPF